MLIGLRGSQAASQEALVMWRNFFFMLHCIVAGNGWMEIRALSIVKGMKRSRAPAWVTQPRESWIPLCPVRCCRCSTIRHQCFGPGIRYKALGSRSTMLQAVRAIGKDDIVRVRTARLPKQPTLDTWKQPIHSGQNNVFVRLPYPHVFQSGINSQTFFVPFACIVTKDALCLPCSQVSCRWEESYWKRSWLFGSHFEIRVFTRER